MDRNRWDGAAAALCLAAALALAWPHLGSLFGDASYALQAFQDALPPTFR